MLSVFTLPFDFRAFPFDWLIVCLILLNIAAVIAYIATYIQFKVKPPLPEYRIHNALEYLFEFTYIRLYTFCCTLWLDLILILQYMLYVLAMILHLILFG